MAQEATNFRSTGRYYEAEFPEVEDYVVVQVLKIDDKIGAYVSLLEYDNKEGMINIGEVSKRRIRSLAKLLRVGSTEVCMVVAVDEEKGYINLSKKRVAAEDVQPKLDEFAKAKAVHGVMQHVASTNNVPVEELSNKVAWPLNAQFRSQGKQALDAFKLHINGELNVWDNIDFSQPGQDLTPVQDKLKKDIEQVLQRRLIASVVRLQAKVEVSCSGYEGIDAVKAALMEGFKASKEECEVNIKLIAHPVFALSCMCRDKDMGIKILDEAMEYVEKAIVAAGGSYLMKTKPTLAQPADEPKGGSSSGSDTGSSSDEEEQDEGMGELKADFSDLANKKVDDGDDDDE